MSKPKVDEFDYVAAAHAEQASVAGRMRHPEVHAFGPPLRRGPLGWGVFAGGDGDDPQLVAVFAHRENAEDFTRRPDPDNPACLLCSGLSIEPVHAVVVLDNDFDADWHTR